jgi:hypothetical protein
MEIAGAFAEVCPGIAEIEYQMSKGRYIRMISKEILELTDSGMGDDARNDFYF